MATHSSICAWRIPMDRRAWWATVHGVGHKHISCLSEGEGRQGQNSDSLGAPDRVLVTLLGSPWTVDPGEP